MTPHPPVKSGRFSSGNERWPDAPAKQRVGSFADGYATWDDGLADVVAELHTVATRLEDETDPCSVDLVTSSLNDVERALRDLSGAIDRAADALIPPGTIGESVSRRYARAAAAWPRAGHGSPPSHERQAQLLSAIHDAAATLRAGAECCRRAR
jgi:hypothetical protein